MSKTAIYFIFMILCAGVCAAMETLIDQEAVAKKWRPLLTAVLVMSAASAVLFLFSGIISFAVGLRGAF